MTPLTDAMQRAHADSALPTWDSLKEYRDLCRKLESSLSDTQNQWHSRSELPTKDGYYLVYNPSWPDERGNLPFKNGAWHWHDEEQTLITPDDNYEFTHWMPRPEAPK